jgi:hypothetical protein
VADYCGCVQQCVLSAFRSGTEAVSLPIWAAITATHQWGFPILPLSACGTSRPSPHLSSAWTVVAFPAAHAGNSTATPGFPYRAPPEVALCYMVNLFHPDSWYVGSKLTMVQYLLAIICGFLELAVRWILCFPSVHKCRVLIWICSDSYH